MTGLQFGAFITPVAAPGESEEHAIKEFFSSCEAAHAMGYHSVWLTEHHFSDYHPAPDPFIMLSHVAARCPGLGLGTGVLVTPWHQPLRLAGQIAALSNVTDAPIFIGMGRGNAPMEYAAFGVDMNYAKEQFAECWDILQLAMSGERFTYKGEHLSVDREVAIHPKPRMDKVKFYGAVGQPASSGLMGGKGLGLMTNGVAPLDVQKSIVDQWTAAAQDKAGCAAMPKIIAPFTVIAETDEKAEELALHYLGEQMKAQQRHYALDRDVQTKIRGFEYMSDENFKKMFRPSEEMARAFMQASFVGMAETVAAKVRALADVGFDYYLINTNFPNCPHDLRREWLGRFMEEVVPLLDREPALVAAAE
ncbi:MAG TPA: LLM class flavin-dependent oxidoreductase [Sphingobium sp.]|nr:LLM class flavin-dependent oxidoreductase [Sphingobium sp.]